MSHSRATSPGTLRYSERFNGRVAAGHFRESQGLTLSSIGLGTYLGHFDDRTDESYRSAIRRALELGSNVIDTASNYRFQRSERAVGSAIAEVVAGRTISRDEIVVSTKGGYLPFDGGPPQSREEIHDYIIDTFVKPGICEEKDFVRGAHCMQPRFLEHQLAQSLRNLQLETVDIYYIHNPETQLAEISADEFYRRLAAAFEYLETAVASGKITIYGTATWGGFRESPESREYVSLARVEETARQVAGEGHHFKVVQLPYNLSMIEAFGFPNQVLNGKAVSFLEAAQSLGITVMASASLLQARLAHTLAPELADKLRGLQTDAQRALQFARSAPGLTTALVGMSQVAHVEENMRVSQVEPADLKSYLELFSASSE